MPPVADSFGSGDVKSPVPAENFAEGQALETIEQSKVPNKAGQEGVRRPWGWVWEKHHSRSPVLVSVPHDFLNMNVEISVVFRILDGELTFQRSEGV